MDRLVVDVDIDLCPGLMMFMFMPWRGAMVMVAFCSPDLQSLGKARRSQDMDVDI